MHIDGSAATHEVANTEAIWDSSDVKRNQASLYCYSSGSQIFIAV